MIDISNVRTLLRLNGLSPQSPHEQIETLLRAARYTEQDILDAFDLLTAETKPQATPQPTSAVAMPVHEETLPKPTIPLPQATTPVPTVVVPTPHIALWEKATPWAVLVLFVTLIALYSVRIIPSLKVIWAGYEGNEQILNQFITFYFLPAIGVSAVIMVIAFFLARLTNISRTLGGWIVTWLCWYTGLWFLVLMALLAGLRWYAKTSVEDWMSFAFSMLASFGLTFAQASYVLVAAALVLLALLSYLLKPKVHTSLIVRVLSAVVLVTAVSFLTYYSGALKYPAQTFKLGFLCYAVAGATERQGCLNASVSVSSSSSSLESIDSPYISGGGILKDESSVILVGGEIAFLGVRPDRMDGRQVVVKNGKEQPVPEDVIVRGPLIDAGGKLAFVGIREVSPVNSQGWQERKEQGSLFLDGQEITSYGDVEDIAYIHGKLAVFARTEAGNVIMWDGKTFTLPDGKEVGWNMYMVEVGTNSIGYAFNDDRTWHIQIDGVDHLSPFVGGLTEFRSTNGVLSYITSKSTIGVGTEFWSTIGDVRVQLPGAVNQTVVLPSGPAYFVEVGKSYSGLSRNQLLGEVGISLAVEGKKSEFVIVHAGKTYGGFERMSGPRELNGKLAFAVQEGTQVTLYRDGQPSETVTVEGELLGLETSKGGKWLIATKSDGVTKAYLNGTYVETPPLVGLYGEHLYGLLKEGATSKSYFDGELFGAGISVTRAVDLNGKAIMFAYDPLSHRASILADKGLLSEEFKANLRK